METRKDNGKTVIIIFIIIGCFLILFGLFGIFRTIGYDKTEGVFTHSVQHTHTDSDGVTSVNYTWYYKFFVDGKEYISTVSSKNYDTPSEKYQKAKILYNPQKPSENKASTDFTDYIMITAGVLFVGIALFFKDSNKNESLSNDSNLKKKKFAWAVILFVSMMFLILLFSVNFDLIALFIGGLPIVIILGIFLFVGIYMLKNADKVKLSDDTTNTFDNDQKYFTNSYDNPFHTVEGQEEDAKKMAYKIMGAIKIVFGLFWTGIACFQTIISLLFVLLSKTSENPSFFVNGVEVTATQFILSDFNPFMIIFLVIGIGIIVSGILDVSKSKKKKSKKTDDKLFIQ